MVTAIEGDHGSTYFRPESEAARVAIACQIELQRLVGGNANNGRRLYPLLAASGFGAVRVSPRMVYVDVSRPALVDGFIRRTFTAMIKGRRERAIAAGFSTPGAFDAGTRATPDSQAGQGVRLHVPPGHGVGGMTYFIPCVRRRLPNSVQPVL